MRDRSGFWPTPPVSGAQLHGMGLSVCLLAPVPQVMVSGALDRFLTLQGMAPPVGLLGQVPSAQYGLRLARNRMLAVGLRQDHATAGWQDGFATTPMTGALAVLDIQGPGAMDLFARASAIAPRCHSPSAALIFAGMPAALCQYDGGLRLHIDRGLVAYLFDWITATGLAQPTETPLTDSAAG